MHVKWKKSELMHISTVEATHNNKLLTLTYNCLWFMQDLNHSFPQQSLELINCVNMCSYVPLHTPFLCGPWP